MYQARLPNVTSIVLLQRLDRCFGSHYAAAAALIVAMLQVHPFFNTAHKDLETLKKCVNSFRRSIATPPNSNAARLAALIQKKPRLGHREFRNEIYFGGLMVSIPANWMPYCWPLSRISTATRPALAVAPTSTSSGHLQRTPRRFLGGEGSGPTIQPIKFIARPSLIFYTRFSV